MGDPEVHAQRCSKVHVNAFIFDTLKAGLWLDPFTTLYESYKPINLPCTPCLGKHRLGWVGMVMKVSWPRTLLNWREPLALLSSSRSTPQPLKWSFIPAFIAVSGLSSLTFHWTLLNIFFSPLPKRTHGLETFQKPWIPEMLRWLLPAGGKDWKGKQKKTQSGNILDKLERKVDF